MYEKVANFDFNPDLQVFSATFVMFRRDEENAVVEMERMLNDDSFVTSRPLSSIINSSSEVYESFDDISYAKGREIIRMIRKIIGEQKFRRGINHYLKKFRLRNARGDDLWRSIDEVLEDNIRGPNGGVLGMLYFGSQWTKQMGFPHVTVECLNSTTVRIKQDRYLKGSYSSELGKYSFPSYGYKWDVPLFYQLGKDEFGLKWLRREGPLYINIEHGKGPIVVNVGRRGYFRQNYDARCWENMIKQFKEDHKIYDALTRFGVISDAFAAAEIGRLDYETVFQLLTYLKKEEDRLVWHTVSRKFKDIVQFYGNELDLEVIKPRLRKILLGRYEKTYKSMDPASSATKNMSRKSINMSGTVEYSTKALSERSERFKISASTSNDYSTLWTTAEILSEMLVM
ncbi:hypothetical protein Y032_0186g1049 [Ancylostoma ceylanicum]|uniref:ERAP1-like C-terminal domain-containing protein n=1 Tax=Ancylostoma ceylanicum TaxID=53326 RepID=A0A016SR97_9BILA|nr:hypothetical protein Y032_0186g1049 [Ancylostoma ceylanicum]